MPGYTGNSANIPVLASKPHHLPPNLPPTANSLDSPVLAGTFHRPHARTQPRPAARAGEPHHPSGPVSRHQHSGRANRQHHSGRVSAHRAPLGKVPRPPLTATKSRATPGTRPISPCWRANRTTCLQTCLLPQIHSIPRFWREPSTAHTRALSLAPRPGRVSPTTPETCEPHHHSGRVSAHRAPLGKVPRSPLTATKRRATPGTRPISPCWPANRTTCLQTCLLPQSL